MPDYDLILRNGTIVDGSGAATYTGDLAKPAGSLVTVSVKVVDAPDGSAADLTKQSVTFRIHGLTTGLFLYPTVPVDASGIATPTPWVLTRTYTRWWFCPKPISTSRRSLP